MLPGALPYLPVARVDPVRSRGALGDVRVLAHGGGFRAADGDDIAAVGVPVLEPVLPGVLGANASAASASTIATIAVSNFIFSDLCLLVPKIYLLERFPQ